MPTDGTAIREAPCEKQSVPKRRTGFTPPTGTCLANFSGNTRPRPVGAGTGPDVARKAVAFHDNGFDNTGTYGVSLTWLVPVKQCVPPYFGFHVAADLELRDSGGFDVLDRFGGVHPGGGASVMLPATSYFGFDVARDLELANSFFVLDGFGGVHEGGGASPMIPPTPYFAFGRR